MAIPLTVKGFREVVGAALDDVFGEPDGWAVYADYRMEDMTWRIAKVEPWHLWKHGGVQGIIHIKEARDEIDAYMQAQRTLEGKYK